MIWGGTISTYNTIHKGSDIKWILTKDRTIVILEPFSLVPHWGFGDLGSVCLGVKHFLKNVFWVF